ncbi:class I SAM-dependent RNA methyltransferase [Leptospira fluminis]|uniref:Class I SAM-dependent RNA methyltransferase n=1 Tax=Leptospira fluminis TaxID=2484979 RepID=A0A4R9GSI4_9LEPT|nr:methyltransferase domain-containing protein [Leptospira fluminis]TGK21186.1 class I SAM-dependent RNA methyltransferase [Leptospira fluminis]
MGSEKNRPWNLKKNLRNSKSKNGNLSEENEIRDIALERWANLGRTIAHTEGKTAFIKAGIPGEIVTVLLEKEKSELLWGRVKSVRNSSPSRIGTDCSSFPECGGCSYRHVSYEEELDIKKGLLLDTLQGIAKFDRSRLPAIAILSGPSDHYRNTAQIKLLRTKKGILPGFYRENSNLFVRLPEEGCRQLPKEMNEYLSFVLKDSTRWTNKEECRLRFFGNSVFEYDKEEATVGPFFEEGLVWKIPAGGFTQVNRFLVQPWLERIRSWIPAGTESVLELYCGAGLISLSLSAKIKRLIGYELSGRSVRMARENAETAGRKNLSFEVLDLEKESLPEKISSESDLWILNPPRSGAAKKVMASLELRKPRSLIYSSCNHTTLARDLRALDEFGYRIEDLVLADFFPRTHHFEVLVRLQRNGNKTHS